MILDFRVDDVVYSEDLVLNCIAEMCLKDSCPKNQKEKCKSGKDRVEKLQEKSSAEISQVLTV